MESLPRIWEMSRPRKPVTHQKQGRCGEAASSRPEGQPAVTGRSRPPQTTVAAVMEPLWTAADLAAYLGYTPGSVRALASSEPGRLPPRVAALTRQRWNPDTVRAWVVKQSTPAGRPRRAVT